MIRHYTLSLSFSLRVSVFGVTPVRRLAWTKIFQSMKFVFIYFFRSYLQSFCLGDLFIFFGYANFAIRYTKIIMLIDHLIIIIFMQTHTHTHTKGFCPCTPKCSDLSANHFHRSKFYKIRLLCTSIVDIEDWPIKLNV